MRLNPNNLPTKLRARHQASLIPAFKPSIMSMRRASLKLISCASLKPMRKLAYAASLLLLLFAALPTAARAEDMDTSTAIFDPMFRTLSVTLDDNLLLDPVLSLGNPQQQLVFSFDEISDDRSYLRCRLLHCNADWQPSRLLENEYVDGFNYAEIEDLGYSSNTFIRYVNYRFTIGQDGLTPLASGNYLWQVFDESDPDKILLQARFRVAEQTVGISGEASARTDRGLNDQFQQLNLVVSDPGSSIPNPYTDIILEATQNSRPDATRFILHPMRVESGRIIYEHIPQLIFPAGNEYRRFETVRNDYPGMHVDSTRYVEPMYNAWLAVDSERADRNYSYDSTQRGRFKVDEYNSTDPDLGADYIMTHFTLDFPEVMDGDIFVEGDLALRGFSAANKMTYDREAHLYRLSLPLKQGSYNYQYVIRPRTTLDSNLTLGGNRTRPDGSLIYADPALVEGNKYETINEYNLYVWLRLPGSRADRLLASASILTR